MVSDFVNEKKAEIIQSPNSRILNGQIGIEKESLRTLNSRISSHPHPTALGSSLFNRYITTDFSEAQLELITAPERNNFEVLKALKNIHSFVSENIGDELIWPLSIPPIFESEDEIKIADYGTSTLALFKNIYRRGLACRYGKSMQAISGLHLNYSLSNDVWATFSSPEQRSYEYMGILRNIFRMNWFLLYLFGASPVITKNFLPKDAALFKRLKSDSYFMPYATSFRMSKYGYCNLDRASLDVSLNSINEYIEDLIKATNTINKDFLRFGSIADGSNNQINSNILQIEDEYYAVARAKSENTTRRKLSSNLLLGGVDFVELRSLDLNPFAPYGIDIETIFFIELFLIYCFVKKSNPLDDREISEINENNSLTSLYGREPNLQIWRKGKKIKISEYGNEILDEISILAELIKNNDSYYKNIISEMRLKVMDPDQTLSGRILDKMISEGLDLVDFGEKIAEKNKDHYKSINIKNNLETDFLIDESKISAEKNMNFQSGKQQSILEYFKDYLDD